MKTAFEYIGRIFGAGEGIGAIVSLTAVSVPIARLLFMTKCKKANRKKKTVSTRKLF